VYPDAAERIPEFVAYLIQNRWSDCCVFSDFHRSFDHCDHARSPIWHRLKARKLELDSQSLSQNLSEEDIQRAKELILGVKAKLEHKKAANKWLQESSKRTQVLKKQCVPVGQTRKGITFVKWSQCLQDRTLLPW